MFCVDVDQWNSQVAIMATLPSQPSPQVVTRTTSGAANDNKVINMTTFVLQQCCQQKRDICLLQLPHQLYSYQIWVQNIVRFLQSITKIFLNFNYKLCTLNGRAGSRFVPSQWDMSLRSNAVSHWLGANLESALKWYCTKWIIQQCTLARIISLRFCIHHITILTILKPGQKLVRISYIL